MMLNNEKNIESDTTKYYVEDVPTIAEYRTSRIKDFLKEIVVAQRMTTITVNAKYPMRFSEITRVSSPQSRYTYSQGAA
ncbi:MAG: hypothetical protein WC479_09435 [Candidatus Izemoplasmatales bacterium]|jgi:hypothetical protein